MATVLDRPFIPSETEAAQAKQALEQIEADNSNSHFIFGSPSGQKAAISESIFKLVIGLLDEISKGNAVMVVPMQAELTTIEAAEFLGVSRPHIVKLLDGREIEHRMVGKHRRILFADLLKYQEQNKRKRLKAIARMTAEDDALFGFND